MNSMFAADPSKKHGVAPHQQNQAQFSLPIAAGPSINTTAVNELVEDSENKDACFDKD